MNSKSRDPMVVQRREPHFHPQVGAADADVDHVGKRFPAAETAKPSLVHAAHEQLHPVEHGTDVRGAVLHPVPEAILFRRPESYVEDGPVLGDVDVLAGEHLVTKILDGGFSDEIGEKIDRPRGDQVSREIQADAAGPLGESLLPTRVSREQFTHVDRPELLLVRPQRLPGGQRFRRFPSFAHGPHPTVSGPDR